MIAKSGSGTLNPVIVVTKQLSLLASWKIGLNVFLPLQNDEQNYKT